MIILGTITLGLMWFSWAKFSKKPTKVKAKK
jgi:hypothetical protein